MAKSTEAWTDENEKQWKQRMTQLFESHLQNAFETYESPLEVGNRLGDVLRGAEVEVANLVVPRSVRKWASLENLSRWEDLLKDENMLLDLRTISTSIANTMRPLAGNKFAMWITEVLNIAFNQHNLSLHCLTKGKIKSDLAKRLIVTPIDGNTKRDYKPDIDIIVVNNTTDKPIAILSAKTTLAERVMQTINWKRYKDQLPQDLRDLKLYLVTAWETFPAGKVNRERVQELDGTYVCNTRAELYGNIKLFESIIDDLKALI